MPGGTSDGAVYVQTNEIENRVIVFRRGADGAFSAVGPWGGLSDTVTGLAAT